MEQLKKETPFVITSGGAFLTAVVAFLTSTFCAEFGEHFGEFLARGFALPEGALQSWGETGYKLGEGVGLMLPIWGLANLAYRANKKGNRAIEEESSEEEAIVTHQD